jgi:hypothetical protein
MHFNVIGMWFVKRIFFTINKVQKYIGHQCMYGDIEHLCLNLHLIGWNWISLKHIYYILLLVI